MPETLALESFLWVGHFVFKSFFFLIGIQLIYNVVLVSGVQQNDSIIHIHISILFQIIFPFRLLQSIKQSSLCYTVGYCWLSILQIVVYIYGFPGGTSDKQSTCQRRRCKRCRLIPGAGIFPGVGSGTPLQYSCLENPMDRGALWATVHETAESGMTERLSTHTVRIC